MATRQQQRRGMALAATLLAALAVGGAVADERVSVSATSTEVAAKALSLSVGGELKVTAFRLEGDTRPSTLELERFEVGSRRGRAVAGAWLQNTRQERNGGMPASTCAASTVHVPPCGAA